MLRLVADPLARNFAFPNFPTQQKTCYFLKVLSFPSSRTFVDAKGDSLPSISDEFCCSPSLRTYDRVNYRCCGRLGALFKAFVDSFVSERTCRSKLILAVFIRLSNQTIPTWSCAWGKPMLIGPRLIVHCTASVGCERVVLVN